MAKPFCSKCFTKDPEPVESDQGKVYWFVLNPDTDVPTDLAVDTDGEVKDCFMAIPDKDFDYNEAEDGKLLCPDCVVDEQDVSDKEESL